MCKKKQHQQSLLKTIETKLCLLRNELIFFDEIFISTDLNIQDEKYFEVLKEVKQTKDLIPLSECIYCQTNSKCKYHSTNLEAIIEDSTELIANIKLAIKEVKATRKRLEKES